MTLFCSRCARTVDVAETLLGGQLEKHLFCNLHCWHQAKSVQQKMATLLLTTLTYEIEVPE